MRLLSHSPEETMALAKKLALSLKGGEIIGLIGDLGAGKTVFTKGLALGLGIKKAITSPTFVLMKIYPVRKGRIKKFIHLDAYRLKSSKEMSALAMEDYFGRPDTVTVIEWAGKIKKVLPPTCLFIFFSSPQEEARTLEFKKPS